MTDPDAKSGLNPGAAVDRFIARWAGSGGAERANYGLFLGELCRVLGVPEPEPTRPDDADNAYVFEKSVLEPHDAGRATVRRIDLSSTNAGVSCSRPNRASNKRPRTRRGSGRR